MNLKTSEIRSATDSDIASIHLLLSHYAQMGDLLPRTQDDIKLNLNNFYVIETAEGIIACGSLENFTVELTEIRSLMVKPNLKKSGYGKQIVEHLVELAKNRGASRIMALTYVPAFFHTLGFRTVNKDIFPEKVWGICVNCYKFKNCDEIAVLREI